MSDLKDRGFGVLPFEQYCLVYHEDKALRECRNKVLLEPKIEHIGIGIRRAQADCEQCASQKCADAIHPPLACQILFQSSASRAAHGHVYGADPWQSYSHQ